MAHVGSIHLHLRDEANQLSFPVYVQYPTATLSKPTAFGPYTLDVSIDAPLLPGKQYPLVILSHGNNGTPLAYRTISSFLARQGCIVALPEHYGNNRNNTSLENTIDNLILRPRHISLTIDHLLADSRFKDQITADKIAVIGHSMGGYTALALAGGIPYTLSGEKVDVTHDPRIKALVLLAPGAGWFNHENNRIDIPILLLHAEHDAITPAWNAAIVQKIMHDPSKLITREIKNAGHFSFLSPFPEQMRSPAFLPATDPAGFDREDFHQKLPGEILDFLGESLSFKF